MSVLIVVPAHKIPDPDPGVIQARKPVGWPLGAVFQGSEQGLRERIVIAHPRPATGGCYAQVVHFAQQGGGLHGRTIVGVKYQWLMQAPLSEHAALQQYCRIVTRLFAMDFPAHPLATEDI